MHDENADSPPRPDKSDTSFAGEVVASAATSVAPAGLLTLALLVAGVEPHLMVPPEFVIAVLSSAAVFALVLVCRLHRRQMARSRRQHESAASSRLALRWSR